MSEPTQSSESLARELEEAARELHQAAADLPEQDPNDGSICEARLRDVAYHYGPSFTGWADLLTRAAAMARQQAAVQKIVDEQAGNEGLWFYAITASEAYMQQELRALHAAVEGTSSDTAIAAQDAKKVG